MSYWILLLIAIPFLFKAWSDSDPINAINHLRSLRVRSDRFFARKQAEKIVDTELKKFRRRAIKEGNEAWLVDDVISEKRSAMIEGLSEKIYLYNQIKYPY